MLIALVAGLQQPQGEPFWTCGSIDCTSDTAIAFDSGARSVRYQVLRNVTFHGDQTGLWLNDGVAFHQSGALVDVDTKRKVGEYRPDVMIETLVLDYGKAVPLWYAIGAPGGYSAVFTAECVEFY